MTLKISPHAIEQDQGPFIFPGILVGSGPGLPSVPDGLLHVWDGSAGAVTAHANADELVVEASGPGGISILVPGDTWANIYFGSATVNNAGFIRYGGVTNQLEFGVNQATIAAWLPGQVFFVGNPFSIFTTGVMALEAVIEIVVNDRGDEVDFRVESDTLTHALFVQGSDGYVGLGVAVPTRKLALAQPADDIGFIISGFDDVAGNNLEVFINNAGESNLVGNANMILRTSSGWVSLRSANNSVYIDIGDAVGAQAVNFRDTGFATVAQIDSDGNAYFLGSVGIGIATPDGTLHVHTATAGVVGPSAHYDDLVVENSDHCGITLLAPNDKYTGIIFGNPADQDEGWVKQYSNQLFFGIDSGDRMRMTASMLAFHQATTLLTDAGALTLTPSTGVIVSSGKYLEIASVLTAGILRLDGGDISSGVNNRVQIAFGFNTSDDYPHFMRTRHNAAAENNAIDFYTCDGTQNGVFPGNAVLGLSIESGAVGIAKEPADGILDINLATEDFAIVDAGSAGATEQDWVEVKVGGNTGYLHVFVGK